MSRLELELKRLIGYLRLHMMTRFLSTKTHKEFDCEHPRVRALQVIEFSCQMGTGRSKPGYIETGSWQPVEEPTINHGVLESSLPEALVAR